MNIILLITGIVLLLAGRRLYWVVVAAAGFFLGSIVAQEFFGDAAQAGGQDAWIVFAVAILGGVVGAILSIFFQKLAVALAGAVGGGVLGAALFGMFELDVAIWIGMIVGAVLGAVLVLKIFDWGLIVISSLVGARFLIDGVELAADTEVMVYFGAFVTGVIVQGLQLRSARKLPPEERRAEARAD